MSPAIKIFLRKVKSYFFQIFSKNSKVLKDFFKKNSQLLIITALFTTVGFFYTNINKSCEVWRVRIEFNDSDTLYVPSKFRKDTFFIDNNVAVRAFYSSIADTLRNQGIFRTDLKLYLYNNLKHEDIDSIADALLENSKATVHEILHAQSIVSRERILYFALLGFFVGVVYERIVLFLRRKPQKKHE
jgi:hypothetical protein